MNASHHLQRQHDSSTIQRQWVFLAIVLVIFLASTFRMLQSTEQVLQSLVSLDRTMPITTATTTNETRSQETFLKSHAVVSPTIPTESSIPQQSQDINTTTTVPPIHSNSSIFSFPHKIDPTDIWEQSTAVPEWMKDYFAWHKQERAKVHWRNWRHFRYLIGFCNGRQKCGGASDRLKPLPLLVYWAARTNRILLLDWTVPTELEEFLLPPQGGMDWRMWPFLHGKFRKYVTAPNQLPRLFSLDKLPAVGARVRHSDAGMSVFNEEMKKFMYTNTTSTGSWRDGTVTENGGDGESRTIPLFQDIYRDLWRTVFTPTIPIQERIRAEMDRMGLQPGRYTAIHLRGLYGVDSRPDHEMQEMTNQAVSCGASLRPDGPLYLASDSKYAIDYMRDKQQQEQQQQQQQQQQLQEEDGSVLLATNTTTRQRMPRVVSIYRDYEPLHIEESVNNTSPLSIHNVSDFYDTFVDLYILGQSRCLAHGIGGYGQWGLWLGYDPSCSHHFIYSPGVAPCKVNETARVKADEDTERKDNAARDLLLPPMK